jgi:type IV secretory pathway VirB2 component (pilin)
MSDNSSSAPAAAVQQMTETAKWLIGVFAAIAGVLLAGVQLTKIGQLDWRDYRLRVAAIAGVLVLIAVGWIIWSVVGS